MEPGSRQHHGRSAAEGVGATGHPAARGSRSKHSAGRCGSLPVKTTTKWTLPFQNRHPRLKPEPSVFFILIGSLTVIKIMKTFHTFPQENKCLA